MVASTLARCQGKQTDNPLALIGVQVLPAAQSLFAVHCGWHLPSAVGCCPAGQVAGFGGGPASTFGAPASVVGVGAPPSTTAVFSQNGKAPSLTSGRAPRPVHSNPAGHFAF